MNNTLLKRIKNKSTYMSPEESNFLFFSQTCFVCLFFLDAVKTFVQLIAMQNHMAAHLITNQRVGSCWNRAIQS